MSSSLLNVAKQEIKRARMHDKGQNDGSLVTMQDIKRSAYIGSQCLCGRCYCCGVFAELRREGES